MFTVLCGKDATRFHPPLPMFPSRGPLSPFPPPSIPVCGGGGTVTLSSHLPSSPFFSCHPLQSSPPPPPPPHVSGRTRRRRGVTNESPRGKRGSQRHHALGELMESERRGQHRAPASHSETHNAPAYARGYQTLPEIMPRSFVYAPLLLSGTLKPIKKCEFPPTFLGQTLEWMSETPGSRPVLKILSAS